MLSHALHASCHVIESVHNTLGNSVPLDLSLFTRPAKITAPNNSNRGIYCLSLDGCISGFRSNQSNFILTITVGGSDVNNGDMSTFGCITMMGWRKKLH